MSDLRYYVDNPDYFARVRGHMADDLLLTLPFNTGEWQGKNTDSFGAGAKTYELIDVMFRIVVQQTVEELQASVMPDLPWAEDHFQERVSGIPHNPPPSHAYWPHGKNGNREFMSADKFAHTYPERYWPQWAGDEYAEMAHSNSLDWEPHRGIRYDYGDLYSVVYLLNTRPHTRQAYLPVWFPEDTGGSVRIEERVPCTLGYHFLIRDGVLSCRYYLRSCDIVRHFTNDAYMAARLMQWVAEKCEVDNLRIGALTMYITSLHGFAGQVDSIRALIR